MLPPQLPSQVRTVLLNALVSYSDACTLPALTPSCPYYVETDAGPRCEEQCRDLIETLGVLDRRVREVKIGGLVLQGRGMPVQIAAGASEFDASERYLQERTLPFSRQGTSSLLLGLKGTLLLLPTIGSGRLQRVASLWTELDRRGIPVERVVRAAVLPTLATQIAIFASYPALKEAGMWDASVSTDFLSKAEASAESWSLVLAEVLAAEPSLDEARSSALQSLPQLSPLRAYLGVADSPLFEIFAPDLKRLPEVASRLLDDVRLPYALSTRFTHRVLEWLEHLVADDVEALVQWQAPPASVLRALPTRTRVPDEVGLWVWERFTVTRPEEWSESTLLTEWRVDTTESDEIPRGARAERVVDADAIASLALTKLSEGRKSVPEPRGLDPAAFVDTAAEHLQANRVQEAADIFAGLVELRPTDGDVINNFGFCLLPLDPRAALEELQRASLYPRSAALISNANRVLALHLVGRDDDAMRLAAEALGAAPATAGLAFAWQHDHSSGNLTLLTSADPRVYLSELQRHLEAIALNTDRRE